MAATWFGAGYWPWGPGTAGSITALPIPALLSAWAGWAPWTFALLALAATPAAMWAAGVVARESGLEDPQIVVVDEVLGQWITLAGAAALTPATLLGGLVLFRLFDIWKPWPVRRLENLPGGIGIVADDLMAGVYGACVLAVASRMLR